MKRKRKYYKKCPFMAAYRFAPTGAIQPINNIMFAIYRAERPLGGAVITKSEEFGIEYNDNGYRIIMLNQDAK